MIRIPRLPSFFIRYVLNPLEAVFVFGIYGFFRIMPVDAASALGGWLARMIGPLTPVSNRALRNLSRAYPEKSAREIRTIVSGMWDNLGRVAAEYPHLGSFHLYDDKGRFEVVGAENVDLLREDERPGIFFSGHIANWEMVSMCATQRGVPLDRVYRVANNWIVEWLYRHGRAVVAGTLIPKGPQGVRALLRSFKGGRHVGLLVDQKMNDGIAVPFFGLDAMTAPALAELALRFDCPVVPGRAIRLKGARFRVELFPPMRFERTGDRHADVLAAMTQVNALLENWVREYPEQWLWLHNRWPD